MSGQVRIGRTAMVTPFRDDVHAVDLDGAQQLASWLVDNGSDALVVAGSTGESPTLSAKEKASCSGRSERRSRAEVSRSAAPAPTRRPRPSS